MRSWAVRALAGVAVIGLGLGLAACGDDDDSSASSTAASSAETTLNFGYVTTAQHPYGLALQAFADKVAKDSAASGHQPAADLRRRQRPDAAR